MEVSERDYITNGDLWTNAEVLLSRVSAVVSERVSKHILEYLRTYRIRTCQTEVVFEEIIGQK